MPIERLFRNVHDNLFSAGNLTSTDPKSTCRHLKRPQNVLKLPFNPSSTLTLHSKSQFLPIKLQKK